MVSPTKTRQKADTENYHCAGELLNPPPKDTASNLVERLACL